MKRTNLVLDGDTLEQARHALGAKTYSETVNRALTETLRRHKMRSMVNFFGKGLWQGDLSEMREDYPGRVQRKKAPRKTVNKRARP
jgi:Arc/MetJ family transcription regulator